MKYIINREENIPFREADGSLMQMIQYRVGVTVENEGDETLEDIERQADEILARNIEKTLSKDTVYNRQKRQLNALVDKIKTLAPTKVKQIVTEIRKMK